jgi:predicted thioesterase
MTIMIPLNASAQRSLAVEKEHTAMEIGSGNLDVLATPMLIALMEAAALAAVQEFLPPGFTTVGVKVDMEHLRATPRGETVTAEAVLARREERALDFTVEARDRFGVVGQGFHRRYIIEERKFLEKIRRS